MAELLKKMFSLIGKSRRASLSGNPTGPDGTASQAESDARGESRGRSPREQEAHLQTLNDGELAQFVSGMPERGVIQLLQGLADQNLQLRVLGGITQESMLKRISRSGLSKKVRRLADKRLRENAQGRAQPDSEKLRALARKIQDFLLNPRWAQGRDLLREAFDPELIHGQEEEETHVQFQTLRNRLKTAVEGYEKTCTEMEDLCEQIDLSKSISKAKLEKLRARWAELTQNYTFPQDFDAIRRFSRSVETRMAAYSDAAHPKDKNKKRSPEEAPQPSNPELPDQSEKQLKALQQREQEEAKLRLEQVASVLAALRELSEQLGQAKADIRLKEVKKAVSELQRWKAEFPSQLEEAESLLKDLLVKRGELANEARWSAWARTDRALRILADLEKTISQVEAESDPAAAISSARGLGQRLFDSVKEMRELGSLEREKDHEIWEQFKALSDRGWAACDKARQFLLDGMKATLSEHLVKPIEFTGAFLLNPRVMVQFRVTAFEQEVAARVRELQSLWNQVGARRSEANREVETVFGRLHEVYFKYLNLHSGQMKRLENQAIQEKRELLLGMKNACEGKSIAFIERMRNARKLNERWGADPIPEAVREELQKEFEGYQAQLSLQYAQEMERQLSVASEIQARLQAILDQVRAKTGVNLPHALQNVTKIENELQAAERGFRQFKAFEMKDPLEERFPGVFQQIRQLVLETRDAIKAETGERAEARNAILQEAQSLALSTDWEASRSRFEELKQAWKVSGALGHAQDALLGQLFDHCWQFYLSRAESRDVAYASGEQAKIRERRKELLLALEALGRFKQPKAGTETSMVPLPLEGAELAKASGKVLELGFKYKQILSLDPKEGILKETRKIMAQWAEQGMTDEELPGFWKYYLSRIQMLLGISPSVAQG